MLMPTLTNFRQICHGTRLGYENENDSRGVLQGGVLQGG